MRVRAMTADDWPAVEAIFAQGIADGEATFEVAPPSWEAFDAGKIDGSLAGPRVGQWRDTILIERRSTRNGLRARRVDRL